MYPSDKKDDDFNFERVLQCFLPLAMYPFGLKGCKKINFLTNAPFGRFYLAMYHSDHFFLKALFLRGLRRKWPSSAQRCVDKEPFVSSTHLAMDFSNAGATEPVGDAFRAHVTWYDKGAKRNRRLKYALMRVLHACC